MKSDVKMASVISDVKMMSERRLKSDVKTTSDDI